MEIAQQLVHKGVEFILNLPFAAYEYLTPPPTTAPFQEGGYFYGYNEDLTLLIASLILFTIVDFAIIKPLVLPKARYFALHVLCNGIACILAFPSVVKTLTGDPLTVFTGPGDTSPQVVIAALHIYHCLAFKLTADDIFHHVTFVCTLPLMSLGFKQVSGTHVCFSAFFISGIPGGIDYLLLTLSAHGIVTKDFQKNVYTSINVWMRSPGLVVYCLIWWITLWNSGFVHGTPLIVIGAACYLHLYNGQYYMQQAVESNALYNYKKKLEKQGIKVPEVRLNDLHKAEKVAVKNGASGKKPN